MNRKLALLWLGTSALSSGCVAYNSNCTIDNSTVVAVTDVPLTVATTTMRSRETALGNLVADAVFLAAKKDNITATLAMIPAANFSTQSSCGSREEIPRGDIRENDIKGLLSGVEDDTLVTIKITTSELKRILEHSVSDLGDATAANTAKQFLQVSGEISFTVDCKQQAQQTCADGSEYAGMRVDNSEIFITHNNQRISLDNWPEDEPIILATTWDFAQGHHGYSLLKEVTVVSTLTLGLNEAVTSYLQEISPITTDKVSSVVEVDNELVFGRIKLLESCY